MKLVIVESPTKARKLSQYLGSEYKVEASVGHVRDLPKSKLGIDIDHDFEPTYEVDPGKTKVVSKLRELAAKAEIVYLATDPDREGEAIAWHIQYLLEHVGGKKKPTTQLTHTYQRATFHEITKSAVLAAMQKPGEVAINLVNAQQARRVVDRLVGYQVSPVLWKKVRRGLSAGRVQSVALRMIVEREREIAAFKPEEYWELDVALAVPSKPLTKSAQEIFIDGKPNPDLDGAMLVARVIERDGKKYEPKAEADVKPLLAMLPSARYQIQEVEHKGRERNSLPPFTTSTLQQAAANKLGFTSKQTMTLAQQLYEEGFITYHRTDSVNLSTQATEMARAFIKTQFGPNYLPAKARSFANKSKNAQEAHEAIRVTDVGLSSEAIVAKSARMTGSHKRLYDLIWRRFLASQMTAAQYDQSSVTVVAKNTATEVAEVKEATLKANGSVMKFDGWTILFPGSEDTLLPEINKGDTAEYLDQTAAQKFTQPPARYNDASLVKELEKRGIGRPSTYASIISVIVDRGYVERREKRFFATSIGEVVSDFLIKHFPAFMEYDFTAEMEEDLDRIARGEKEWHSVVREFYKPLEAIISSVTKEADRVQIPVERTGEKCPLCGDTEQGEVVIRNGRFGKFKSCSRYPECKFTENIVDKVPDVKCPLCQEGEVIIKPSRWGKPFFGCSRYPECKWASWRKPALGERISQEEWDRQQAERAARKAEKEAAAAKEGGVAPKAKPAARKKASPKKATKKTIQK